jgi:hypothetical protein
MFAPTVFKDDGWYVYEGVTKDGKHIDICRNGKKVSYKKPVSIVNMFKNDRWRKFSENVLFTHQQFLRPSLCTYLMKKWNRENPDRILENFFIIYMKEVSLPDYKISKPVRDVLIQYK